MNYKCSNKRCNNRPEKPGKCSACVKIWEQTMVDVRKGHPEFFQDYWWGKLESKGSFPLRDLIQALNLDGR